MTEPENQNQQPTPPSGPGYAPDLGKEFGRGGRTLPVVGALLIGGVVLGVVGFIIMMYIGQKQPGGGAIENVAVAELGDQKSVLVAVTVTLVNKLDRPFWVQRIQGTLDTAEGHWSDDASAASDQERYFQAFPALRQGSTTPLKYDDKLQAGQQVRGTVVFSFPVTKAQFDQRRSLSVNIEPHSMRTITITQALQ